MSALSRLWVALLLKWMDLKKGWRKILTGKKKPKSFKVILVRGHPCSSWDNRLMELAQWLSILEICLLSFPGSFEQQVFKIWSGKLWRLPYAQPQQQRSNANQWWLTWMGHSFASTVQVSLQKEILLASKYCSVTLAQGMLIDWCCFRPLYKESCLRQTVLFESSLTVV